MSKRAKVKRKLQKVMARAAKVHAESDTIIKRSVSVEEAVTSLEKRTALWPHRVEAR